MAIPRNGKCASCNALVPGGERFNAIKRTIGEHAYRFQFTCKNCKATLFMSTDPARAEFVFEHPLHEMKSYLADKRRDEEARNAPAPLPIEVVERKRAETAFVDGRLFPRAGGDEASRAASVRNALRNQRRERRHALEQGRKRGMAVALLPVDASDNAASASAAAAASATQPPFVLLGSAPQRPSDVQLVVVKSKRRKATTA